MADLGETQTHNEADMPRSHNANVHGLLDSTHPPGRWSDRVDACSPRGEGMRPLHCGSAEVTIAAKN
jgi:hypothetical protein